MSYLATKLTGSNKMVLNDQTLPTVVNFHFVSNFHPWWLFFQWF